jgi:predicted nucleic acid-binding Zn ribbon protein
MADSHTPQPLGAVLGALFQERGYRQKIDEARAVDAWKQVAVAGAVRATETAWIRDGVLTVKLRSAAWRHTLHLQREDWRQRLNAHLGREVVREIVFR